MAIQWGNNSALAGFQNALALGADIGGAIRQNREDSALAAFMTASGEPAGDVPSGGMGAPTVGNPPMPTQWGGNGGGIVPTETQKSESQAAYERLAKVNPRLALQAGSYMEDRQAKRAKAMQEQAQNGFAGLQKVGQLLEGVSDEATYQQTLSMAQQNGIDISRVPKNYDPQWVEGQKGFIKKLQDPKAQEALSTAGKIAVDMGFKPGTTEHAQKTIEVWQSSEAKPYVVGGETRLYRPSLSGGGASLAPKIIPTRPAGKTDADLFREAREAVENGADRNTVFEQLQAWGVKP